MNDRTPKISADDYKALFAKPEKKKRGNKYNAQSTVVDGLHFPSQLEAAVWCALKMMQRCGEVTSLSRYPSVKLPGGVTWKVDFKAHHTQSGEDELHEAKGVETADYRVKLKLYEEFGDRPLHIWKGDAAKPFIWKTILPKGAK